MKRIIQFKIWVYDFNHMVPLPPVGEEEGDGHKTSYASYTGKNTNMEWLQNIGIKDKNGKDIYEGDILATSNDCNDYDIWTKEDYGYTVVEWNSEATEFMGSKWSWDMSEDCESVYDMKFVEVIGNIYENSELMKKKD